MTYNNSETLNGRKLEKNSDFDLSAQQLNETERSPTINRSRDDWSHATLEVVDSLPQVWTRGFLYFLIVFIAIALPWAALSQVDETVAARGRLEPKGKTIKLDAPVAGEVAAIEVKEGKKVRAGQILVELESKLASSELQQQQRKLEGQQTQLNQLKLLKNQLLLAIHTQEQQNQAQLLEKQAQLEGSRQNLESLKILYNLQKEEQLALLEQAKGAIESSKVAYKVATIQLQAAREKYPRYQIAFQQGVISQDRFKDAEHLVAENSARLVQAQSEIYQAESRFKERQSSYQKIIQQARAEIQQAQLYLEEQRNSYQSLLNSGKLALLKTKEQFKNLEREITTLNSEISQSQSQIESLQFQLEQRVLKAPIDGTVFELPVQSIGVVVQPGDPIVEIAPVGSSLVLRALLPTTQKESGSLEIGMPVKIKFDAYPFQDYGVVEGHLSWVSPDSQISETEQGQIENFELEIELDRVDLEAANQEISLSTGQTATAEIIVRQRRVIDFIFDPFKKLQKSGLEL